MAANCSQSYTVLIVCQSLILLTIILLVRIYNYTLVNEFLKTMWSFYNGVILRKRRYLN